VLEIPKKRLKLMCMLLLGGVSAGGGASGGSGLAVLAGPGPSAAALADGLTRRIMALDQVLCRAANGEVYMMELR
jgi:hypothetical protein